MPTYSFDEDLTTDRDRARALMGDTGPDRWVVSDETIDLWLTYRADPCKAAVFGLRLKAAETARTGSVSRTVGDLSISGGGGGADYYKALADDLERFCAKGTDEPVIVPFGPYGQEPRPIFTVGMHDDPSHPGRVAGHR